MIVIRFGEFWQPAWARTALVFTDTTSAVAGRLQPAITRVAAITQEATNLVAAFLTPAAVLAAVLAFWRLGADLGWTGAFAISNGIFSHWQVWMGLALCLKMTGSMMNRSSDEGGQQDS